jgi:hypothetical protein
MLLGTILLACPAQAQPPAPALQPSPLPRLSPVPAAIEPAPAENLLSFDPREARVAWQQNRWQVVAGEHVLKDFGRREAEARQALRLIQDLGLTQRGTVGAPALVMEYWLAGGRAPTGLTPGLRVLSIDLASLRVEQIQAQWCLRDDLHVLYNFGLRSQEARRALAILRRYGFSRIAVIGQAVPSMTVLLSSTDVSDAVDALHSAHLRGTAARQAQGPSAPSTMLGSVVTPALPPVQEGGSAACHIHPVAFKGQPGDRKPGALAPSLPGWDEQGEWVPFDWRQVQLRQEEGGWKLAAGSLVLASFGDDAEVARLALAAVRHYRLTEQCRVGGPEPVFCYYLANGQAPRGLMFGLTGLAFRPDKLSVERLGRTWAVCEAEKVILILGEQADDAERLLEVIRRQQFDRLVRLGPPQGPGMTLLVRVH